MRKFSNVKNAVATLAMALFVIAAVGAAEAKADPVYNYETDKIEAAGDDVYYVANVKKAEGSKLKASDFQKVTSGTAIAMDKGGFKASLSKNAYLYWSDKDPAADVEKLKTTIFVPNLIIDASAYKKTVVNLDYTKLGLAKMMVASVDVTKNESGATVAKMPAADVPIKVSWSEDGINDWELLDEFTGGKVAPKIASEKYVVYFRVDGTSKQRPSKMVKVTLPKRAKAPSVKVDVKKLTLNIKNGYDFATMHIPSGCTATVSGTSIVVSGGAWIFDEVASPDTPLTISLVWNTILPTDKEGAYKGTNGKDTAIKPTADYIPMNKKDEGAKANSFTNIKKTFDLNIDGHIGDDKEMVPYQTALLVVTRKTATTKKPASLVNYIIVDAAAGSPKFERTTIATATAIGFVTPLLENDYDFKLVSDAGPTEELEFKKVRKDLVTAKFEYAIVAKTDFDSTADPINFASIGWKTIKTGTKIKANAKTKYALVSDLKNKKEATFGTASYLIIRRAGVSKTGDVASKVLVTSVKQITGGYEWYVQ